MKGKIGFFSAMPFEYPPPTSGQRPKPQATLLDSLVKAIASRHGLSYVAAFRRLQAESPQVIELYMSSWRRKPTS